MRVKNIELRVKSMLNYRLKTNFNSTTVYGYKIRFLDPSFFQFNLRELFDGNEYFVEIDAPAPTIVDCGANIGLATLYFKKLFPAAKVIAIEAHPDTFAVLESNVKENKLQNVTVMNVAVTRTGEGEVNLFSSAEKGDLRSTTIKELYNDDQKKLTSMSVKAARLSEILPDHVDLLKMDIEGSEVEVLEEIADHLHKIDRIMLEFHTIPGKSDMTLGDMLRFLEQNGYTCRVKGSPAEPISSFAEKPFANVVYAVRSAQNAAGHRVS